MKYDSEYLFLQFKDGREFHQNKSLTNINAYTVCSLSLLYHSYESSTILGNITKCNLGLMPNLLVFKVTLWSFGALVIFPELQY